MSSDMSIPSNFPFVSSPIFLFKNSIHSLASSQRGSLDSSLSKRPIAFTPSSGVAPWALNPVALILMVSPFFSYFILSLDLSKILFSNSSLASIIAYASAGTTFAAVPPFISRSLTLLFSLHS